VEGWADSVWLQGQRFGTVGVVRQGVVIEITTFRADVYRSESRKPTVTYSDTIEADLSRRDFTVNAIAASVPELELVDPFGGYDDLGLRVLRTPQSPTVSFTDDPLRMLRAARFASAYGFVPVPELVEAMREHRSRLAIVSAERIHDELVKLLLAADPSVGFGLLESTGVLAEFLPEAVRTAELAAVEATENRRLAVLFADVDPEAVRRRLHELRFPHDVVDASVRISRVLALEAETPEWTDPMVREAALTAGDSLADLIAVLEALARGSAFLDAVATLAAREVLGVIDLPIDGGEVMTHLGLEPGRAVGEAMHALRRARIEHGPLDEEAARRVLDEWAGR
jgi:poly(A) polymerase